MKIFTIAVSLIAVVGWTLVSVNLASGAVADQTPTFDHFQCQYPLRTTNPVNGCDNSDPACPAEIKGGTCTPPQQKPVQTCKE